MLHEITGKRRDRVYSAQTGLKVLPLTRTEITAPPRRTRPRSGRSLSARAPEFVQPFLPVNSSQRFTITSLDGGSSSIKNARQPGELALGHAEPPAAKRPDSPGGKPAARDLCAFRSPRGRRNAYLREYGTVPALKAGIEAHVERYYTRRPHWALGVITPQMICEGKRTSVA